jgi:hypothetical protein
MVKQFQTQSAPLTGVIPVNEAFLKNINTAEVCMTGVIGTSEAQNLLNI